MKKLLLIALLGLIHFTLAAQAGTTRPLSDFDRLDVSGAFDIYLKPGETNSIRIEPKGVALEEIVAEVRNRSLRLKLKDKHQRINQNKRSVIYVTYRALNRIDWSGAGTLETQSALIADRLILDISGAGHVRMQLSVKNLEASMSGAGKLELTGRAVTQRVTLSGVGSYSGADLESETAVVNHSGVGAVEVNVRKQLEANASGIGNILYAGHPKVINTNSSFLGKVKPL